MYFVQCIAKILGKCVCWFEAFLCLSSVPHPHNLFSRSSVVFIVLIISLFSNKLFAQVFNVTDL